MRPFDNRRVLVTRSDRGIGKGSRSVLKAARRFCSSPGAATNSTRCALLELTSEARAVALDLTLLDSARQVVTAAADAWDGLDILVTNGGAAPQGGFLELDDTEWPTVFGLKMFANLRMIRHACRCLRSPLATW